LRGIYLLSLFAFPPLFFFLQQQISVFNGFRFTTSFSTLHLSLFRETSLSFLVWTSPFYSLWHFHRPIHTTSWDLSPFQTSLSLSTSLILVFSEVKCYPTFGSSCFVDGFSPCLFIGSLFLCERFHTLIPRTLERPPCLPREKRGLGFPLSPASPSFSSPLSRHLYA